MVQRKTRQIQIFLLAGEINGFLKLRRRICVLAAARWRCAAMLNLPPRRRAVLIAVGSTY